MLASKTLSLSERELKKLELIQKVEEKRLKQKQAAQQLNLSERQLRRLLSNYRQHGAAGLISKHRNRPSNRGLSPLFKGRVMELVHQYYSDFGPTLASEKLLERHELKINRETLRQWMIEAGCHKATHAKQPVHHTGRLRRAHFGELVQIDGSPHDWFEDRGERCCLINFIDDATGAVLAARFFPVETTDAYFETAKVHFEHYGMPMAYYSDRHGIFRVNQKMQTGGETMSQFERAMQQLGIELINANSPQAKGRVERLNKTLQDRLVKEFRLEGISTIAEANAFMDAYLAKYNDKFAIMPRELFDVHVRPPEKPQRDFILSRHYERKLSKTLTIQYENKHFQINEHGKGYRLRHATVTVCEDANHEITIHYKDRQLNYTVFDKQMQHSVIQSAKEIETPRKLPKQKHPICSRNTPWRNFVINPKKTHLQQQQGQAAGVSLHY